MPIPQDFITALRDRCDIADTVGSYVTLKRAGRLYKGLCPFHSEKTPSFTVYPDTASFYCFGCQAGGDLITFIMQIERLDYVEAVKLLAGRAGMDMPEDGAFDGLSLAKRRMREANREAARFFHRQLFTPQGAEALAYLRSRGLSDETITHFGLGWSPDAWDELSLHLTSLGFRSDEVIGANLAMENRYGKLTDRFRNRVMFPIIDLQGSVIAFGGRTMEKEHGGRKYLNTSDTLIYKKTNNLYGFNWAKGKCSDRLVVTEGYMDVIAMWQAGIENVVASQGTAFTSEQARLVARYTTQVVLAQDGDAAGQNAIRKSIPTLKAVGIDVRVLEIPEQLDPDEFIKKYGADRMKLLISGCESDIDYTIRRIRAEFDLATNDGRLHFLRRICPVLAELSPLEREVYVGNIASDLGVDKEAILSQVKIDLKRRHAADSREELKSLESAITGRADRVNPERSGNVRAAAAEEAVIANLFRRPELAASLRAKLPPERMLTVFNRRLYSTLLEMSDSGCTPDISQLAQTLTSEEMGAASRILNTAQGGGASETELERFIAIIDEERERPDKDAIADTSAQDLKKYLESLKKKKQ